MVSSTNAGSSAARLARSVRDAEVGGSNPLSPTAPGVALRRSRFSFSDSPTMSNIDAAVMGEATAGARHGEGNSAQERLRAIPAVSAIVTEAKRLGTELPEDVLTRVARAELENVRQALLAGERLDRPQIVRRVIEAVEV